MARRGHHSLEQIKEMVLIAAEDLVIEGGLSHLRIRNIAAKIGYTVGSIYMVFDNMDDLIFHVKARALDELAGQMSCIPADSPEQRLEWLATVFINYVNKNLNRWNLIFEHRLPEGSLCPEWYKQKLARFYNTFETEFANLYPGLDAIQHKQAALAFLGGLQGICSLVLTTQIAGVNDLDLHGSANLLTQRIINTSWQGFIKELMPAHSPISDPSHLWAAAAG